MSPHSRRRTSPARTNEGRVHEAMRALPRTLFFPPGPSPLIANVDAVPLGGGRTIPPVHVVETMVRALGLEPSDRVLEIGCGSGYQTAILAKLARSVVATEADSELAARTGNRLRELGIDNVEIHHAVGDAGWPASGPFRAIIVGAAAAELPEALIEQLGVGGRLVIALGSPNAQLITRVHRAATSVTTETVGLCRLDMLPNAEQRPSSFPWVPSTTAASQRPLTSRETAR
jgi:protein-L-isoaspartate(D-aspartate) O-methyltransferase